MKLVNVLIDGEERAGILNDDGSVSFFDMLETMMDVILAVEDVESGKRAEFLNSNLSGETALKDSFRIVAPIVKPVKDILCVGLNYADHIRESQSVSASSGGKTDFTAYFTKRFDYIRSDGDTIEGWFDTDKELDYETELTVVIGKGGRSIKKEDAFDHIFGFTVGNDISSRELQRNHKQWFLGKSPDGYTAMGPCILLYEGEGERPFRIKTAVNGEVRQNESTELLIKNVSDIIYEMSRCMSLVPGDFIMTGTPKGVGMGYPGGNFLKSGDRVISSIDEIGQFELNIK